MKASKVTASATTSKASAKPAATDTHALDVSFESHAATIVNARVAADKAESKFRDVLNMAINGFVDAVRASGFYVDEATCKALAAEITGCQTAVEAVASGLFEAKTFGEYAQGAQRAFFHGVPWTASLKNDPAMALPWSKRAKTGAKPAGTTATTKAPSEALPAAPDMGTQSTEEIRAFIQGQARTLLAYLNKHLANADLQTRDVVQHFAQAAAKLPALK